jgi:glutamate synthase domain-containing protein 2
MTEMDSYPDFITVDGGEGGQAQLLRNSQILGMPLQDGLAFADNILKGFNIRQHINLLHPKDLTGFHARHC